MYKVFIDNTEMVFTNSEVEIGRGFYDVKFHEDTDGLKNVLKIIDTQKDSKILVFCKQPEQAIKKVFHGFHFMEAAGGIVKRNDTYLFIERFGVWDIPKGKIEKNEQPWEAAIREVEEECGIEKPTISHLIGHTFHTYMYKAKPTLKKNWWYALNYDGDQTLKPQEEESITQAIWVDKNKWKMIESNTYASIREVLKQAKDW